MSLTWVVRRRQQTLVDLEGGEELGSIGPDFLGLAQRDPEGA